MTTYNYTINPFNADSLTLEIQQSTITIVLDHISALGSSVDIVFKADLPTGDKTTLDAVVAAHTGIPLITNPVANVAITSTPPLANNNAGNGKFFYQRAVGIRQTLSAGSNTFTWTQSTFPMSQVYAIEVIGAENGDYTDFIVLDTSTGTLSGVPNYPLNQFGFTTNLAPGFYSREAKFPATIIEGLQFKFVYNSVSAKTVGINIIFHEIK